MVETVGIHQVLWLVMLESAKDRVLGVDTLGQQVQSCVRYRMTCLLIRDAVGCESCLVVWRNHYSWVQCANLCKVYNYHDS
jgi:hypothetical protein